MSIIMYSILPIVSSQPYAATNPLSVFVDLSLLDTSFKWNYMCSLVTWFFAFVFFSSFYFIIFYIYLHVYTLFSHLPPR
jgi:hypothetical protein